MMFSYLLTLLGVCGLAVGSLIVLRSAKGGGLVLRNAQPIRVVGRQGLGAGSSLILVEVDGQRMLIGVSRAGIGLLDSRTVASPNVVPIGQSFSAVIKRAGAQR
jgi:flagellar protein FliO/FliZ